MNRFDGFPARTEFTPVPNAFFSRLLPHITDIAELKITLHLFAMLYRKRGYPRFVTHRELLADPELVRGLGGEGTPAGEVLRRGLEMATERGTILRVALDREDEPDEAYFLNTPSDRRAAARIENGELAHSGLRTRRPVADAGLEATPNIFALYEENIGMLTPMLADELREAEKLYPESWIKDAIREAVSLNKRSWRYVARILENWTNEGRADGTRQRDTGRTDPDKFIKGKYGHRVQR